MVGARGIQHGILRHASDGHGRSCGGLSNAGSTHLNPCSAQIDLGAPLAQTARLELVEAGLSAVGTHLLRVELLPLRVSLTLMATVLSSALTSLTPKLREPGDQLRAARPGWGSKPAQCHQ